MMLSSYIRAVDSIKYNSTQFQIGYPLDLIIFYCLQGWFEADNHKTNNVYVSNMPSDITLEEYTEMMSKAGMIMYDPSTRKPKVKLYTDDQGKNKGDGLCCYIKVSPACPNRDFGLSSCDFSLSFCIERSWLSYEAFNKLIKNMRFF